MAAPATRSSKENDIVDPPSDLQQLLNFKHFLENHSAPALLIGPDGEQVLMPVEVYEALCIVVEAMEAGNSVSVRPLDMLLTTQQAANLLGISRSTLIRLLEEHELAYERYGESRHRRLRLHDVLAYRDRKRAERISRLDEISRQAYEAGLYEASADTYERALKKARKGQ